MNDNGSSPFFSILIAAWNAEHTIVRSLESILLQDFTDYEIVFVDDCSSDKTLSFAYPLLLASPSFRLISNIINLGLTESLNIGLSYCTGKFIARLDADDISTSNRLSLAYYYHSLGFDIVGSSSLSIESSPSIVAENTCRVDASYIPISHFNDNPYSHSSVSFRRCFLNSCPVLYDPFFKKAQDFELWNRLTSAGFTSCFLTPPNCYRSDSPNSITNTSYISQRYYAMIIRLKYHPSKLSTYWFLSLDLFFSIYSFLRLRSLIRLTFRLLVTSK